MAKEIKLIVEDEKVTGITTKTKIYKLKTNKRGTALNYRFKLPIEIFNALYSEWQSGLKIYLYKKDTNDKYIYLSSVQHDNSYKFSIFRQNKETINPMVNINANMEYLEPNYKNRTETIFICDTNGIKMFFV